MIQGSIGEYLHNSTGDILQRRAIVQRAATSSNILKKATPPVSLPDNLPNKVTGGFEIYIRFCRFVKKRE